MKTLPVSGESKEESVEIKTIGSLTPINGTYFESQGLIDDEYEEETI